MSRTLAVEYRPTETLHSRPQTARVHSKRQLAQIAKAITRWGFTQPLLVDAEGVIWAGEARWKAAISLGEVVVPTIDISHLSVEELRAYAIADNKLAEMARWDEVALQLEIVELADLGVDLTTGVGLAEHELQRFLRPEFNDPDTISPPLEDAYRSRRGDVWMLGAHRLICGDATDPEAVAQLLGADRPHLMCTDPPYGVDYDPAWRATAGLASDGIARGKVLNDTRADWREAWALFPGTVAYVWHGGLHGAVVAQSLVFCGFRVRAQIIWVKQRPAISRGNYHWQHEPAFYASRDGEDDRWQHEHDVASYAVKDKAIANWTGGRRQSTVWFIDHLKNDSGHGTQKPIECMRRPILNNSRKGDAVYEPFSGSGTTILAGEQTERRIRALELDPRYVDLAVRRWQLMTGVRAIREADGAAFDDLEPMHGQARTAAEADSTARA